MQINEMQKTLSSFDIFETVLIRKCGSPENVFFILANTLFPDDKTLQLEFFNWRLTAENRLEDFSNASIYDIYRTVSLQQFFGVSAEYAIEQELAIERKSLMANPAIVALIDQRRRDGDSIAFITDIYLPSTFIQEVLYEVGVYHDGDALFVSNEIRCRKDSGRLFEYVHRSLNIDKWTHYGDIVFGDIRMAKLHGLKAVHINTGYNHYESKMLSLASHSSAYREISILVGASRAARIGANDNSASTLSSDFMIPLYFSYISYVLADAHRRGITTLMFVMRDGYIFKEIADRLPHDGINLKLLYISRRTIQNAYFYGKTSDKISPLVSERANWRVVSEEDSNNTLSYLRQEGVFNDGIAFVDVGWLGTTRLMLEDIRASNGSTPSFYYYWGLCDGFIPSSFGAYDVFSPLINHSPWETFLFEDYFSASPCKTTVSYKFVNDHYEPVFADGKPANADVVSTNERCVDSVTEYLGSLSISPPSLCLWKDSAFDILFHESEYIDFSPFASISDSKEFSIRRLNKKELNSYIRGGNITTNDEVSISVFHGRYFAQLMSLLRKLYSKSSSIYHLLKRKVVASFHTQQGC